MKAKEQFQLIRLLHTYMSELGEKLVEKNSYDNYGLKAQFEHARIIATKLSTDLNQKMDSYGIREDE